MDIPKHRFKNLRKQNKLKETLYAFIYFYSNKTKAKGNYFY